MRLRKRFGYWPIILVLWVIAVSIPSSFETGGNIPSWVKTNAKWWSQGALGDGDFTQGIQYLIEQNIISMPAQNETASGASTVPAWVKHVAGMWTNGQVSDDDFLKGMEYLVRIGIIHVEPHKVQTEPEAPSKTIPVPNQFQPLPPTASLPQLVQANLSTPIPPPVSVAPSTSNSTLTNTKSNQSEPLPAPQVETIPSQTVTKTDSFEGQGVDLRINGNAASGTLVLGGIQYKAPSLAMTWQGTQVQMQGNVQTSESSLLQVVGVAGNGNLYNFYGSVSSNGKFAPVQFSATLNRAEDQPLSPINTQAATPAQTPLLPMMLLYAQSDRVTMGYPYSLAVKIFDPKANPDKTFDQFTGGIPNVSIEGYMTDQSNQKISSFSGTTDDKGLYQYSITAPYFQGWSQTFKVFVNAAKAGYAPQSATTEFVTFYSSTGGCAAPSPTTPTWINATASFMPTKITLYWNPGVTGSLYTIFKSINSTGIYNMTLGPTSGTSYVDTNLKNGTTYHYIEQASNCKGSSANGTDISATP